MSIVIWGAGAIGGTIGAYLQRAGQDVIFVDLVEDHVAAINQDGLTITGPVDQFTARAQAHTPASLSGAYQTILLCVKSQHTASATEMLLPFLADDGIVVSAQNGLNELLIQDIIGAERTLGCFVNFSADYHSPGEILFGGRGAVVLGELDGSMSPRLERLAGLLRNFDPDTLTTDNIWGYLWGKEAYGAMLFVSALTHQSIAEALSDQRYRAIYVRAAQEILSLAARLEVEVYGFNGFEPADFLADDGAAINQSLATLVAFNSQSAKTHSGIWRDLAVRKRETEVSMYDAILAQAERLNHKLPLTRAWIRMIRQIESGQRQQSLSNLDELKAALR